VKRIAILLFLLAAACRRAPEHPPVILISIDTLRADHLHAYGGAAKTPNIDALAADGVVCEAWSHVPLTLPSHLTILTGLLPPQHGVRDNAGYVFDANAHPTLAATLHAHGYRTGAAVSAYVLRAATGVASGFETYDDAIGMVDGAPLGALRRDGRETGRIAEAWIAAHAREPFFFFLHLYEPHAPYDPSYDGAIGKADAIVGKLIASLKARGVYDRAAIVLLSDHGEGLGDHGEAEHGVFLYREALQVPLIVKLPLGERRRVVRRVSLSEVMPTILDIANVEHGPTIFGSGDRSIYSESLYGRIHFGWSELRSLVRGQYHFIDAPRAELYDAARDVRERRNIVTEDRRAYAAMRGALWYVGGAFVAPAKIEAEEAKKLAALGYVSAGAETSGPLPDPKDRIADANRLEAAVRSHDVAQMQSLLDANPRWSDLRDQLGAAYEARGDSARAAQVAEEGITVTPSLASRFALAAGYARLEQHDFAAAARDAQVALRTEPAAHLLLGEIALARNDAMGAEREARIAEESSSERAQAMFIEARAAALRQDSMRTLDLLAACEQEVQRTQGSLPQHFDYVRGDTLAHTNDVEDAESAFNASIAREPRFDPAYRGLAIVQMIRGDRTAMNTTLARLKQVAPTPENVRFAADLAKSRPPERVAP
jgi:choline-sulfatase